MTGSSDPNFPTGIPSGLPAALRPGDADPFAHLHKMSTTAGVGSGEYVAINGTSVIAMLVGAGSAFVLFNSPSLLVIPFAGIVLSIVAWRQISNSNGTLTGREVAAVGLLLSLAFGGYGSVKAILTKFREHADEVQIVAQARKLGDLLGGDMVRAKEKLEDARFAAAKKMGVDYQAAKTAATEARNKLNLARMLRGDAAPALTFSQQADEKVSDMQTQLHADPAVAAAEQAVDAAAPRYIEAYAMFDSNFRNHFTLAQFQAAWQHLNTHPLLGDLQDIDWNHLLNFDVDPVDQTRIATGVMFIKFTPQDPMRVPTIFRNEDGNWLVDQMQGIFSIDEKKQQDQKQKNTFIGPPKP